jgi:hypothetical protein
MAKPSTPSRAANYNEFQKGQQQMPYVNAGKESSCGNLDISQQVKRK